MLKQLNVLEGTGNTHRCHILGCFVGEFDALVVNFTGRWSVDTADQIEDRCFTCAIGANQGEDLSLFDIEADVINRQHAPKAHAQVFGRKKNVGHRLNAPGPPQGVRDPSGGSEVHEVTNVGVISSDPIFGTISAA